MGSGGCCYPLGIVDDHSRYCMGLYPLRDPTYERVRRSLGQPFEEYGVPEGMLFDHGSPWWGSSNVLGLTRLGVDLIEQGVRCGIEGVLLKSLHRRLGLLGEIRHSYNYIRPHEALNMQVPAHR